MSWPGSGVRQWAGLLRTWLRDYGFPSVGRKPQQLPRGCLQPPSAASSWAWLPANTSSFNSRSGRAPRGLRRGDLIHLCEPEACEGCFCFGPGGLVHKAPGPHPLSGRDRSQPPTVGPLLAHSSPPLSSPCEQPCVSLPTQSDTWFLLLPSAPSASLLFSRFFSLGNPHPSFVYSLHPCLFLLLSPALCSFSLHPPRPPQDRQHQESRDCAPLADHCIPRI